MNKAFRFLAFSLAALSAESAFSKENEAVPAVQYLGHASLCITVGEKTVYIDPFMGDYEKTADVILVTHQHPDHNRLDLVKNRSSDCVIITEKEALKGGKHRTFDLGFMSVEAVTAGNKNHSEKNCVGYILTFKNNKTLYISGDTSKVPQMESLKARNLDWAFFCCDGIYNMDVAEASECAKIISAKHSVPYHTKPGAAFDLSTAERFSAPGKHILKPGEVLLVE